MDKVERSFEPIVGPATRLLLLGSLPGAASLAARRYYANPRNQFWRLLEQVIDRPLHSLDYPDRLAALDAAGVGLWDTVGSATRRGSLDADIRLKTANDLGMLIESLPALRAIGLNGGTAARIARRQLAGRSTPPLIDLPSSSPAYTLAFKRKAEAWRQLRPFLGR